MHLAHKSRKKTLKLKNLKFQKSVSSVSGCSYEVKVHAEESHNIPAVDDDDDDEEASEDPEEEEGADNLIPPIGQVEDVSAIRKEIKQFLSETGGEEV